MQGLKVTPSSCALTQLGHGARCHLSWCISHALGLLHPCLRPIEVFLLPQDFAWNGLVHLIKHYVSTLPHTPPTSPPRLSPEESQVGFTRLLSLLLNSVRLVNNSAATEPTNKQASNTNGQKGRWKNERERKTKCESDSFCWRSFCKGRTSSKKLCLFLHSLQLCSHPLKKQGVCLTLP